MKINTALILCAGFGKRLNPITLSTPKPLLEIKNITMLERCINLIVEIGAKKILLNTFHLENQILEFIKKKKISNRYTGNSRWTKYFGYRRRYIKYD